MAGTLNQANANKLLSGLVSPHIRFLKDTNARSQIEGLLRQLRERPNDDLDFGYQVRNRIIKLFRDNGVEPRSGTGNLYGTIANGISNLDRGLDADGMPTLRGYEINDEPPK